MSLPLSVTRALSWTVPRSSRQLVIAPTEAGRGNSMLYVAVPEKFFTSSPGRSVHEPSGAFCTVAGSVGPPETNDSVHRPASARGASAGSTYDHGAPGTTRSNVRTMRDAPTGNW